MELFTEEKVYDEKISPLMKQIIAICKEHKIPMIATFIYENDENSDEGAATTYLNFGGDDRFSDCLSRAYKVLRVGIHSAMAITISSNPISTGD